MRQQVEKVREREKSFNSKQGSHKTLGRTVVFFFGPLLC